MNLWEPKTMKQVMAMFHLGFRKEYGQNFLTDLSVLEEIADVCSENKNSTVLEIGPGIGTLTQQLAERYASVIALEIDTGLIPVLDYTLGDYSNVKILNQDVMKADLSELLSESFQKNQVSVCANLPYYITTPILMKLLESELPFENITVMVQKEVAERLCAPAGGKDYGAITAAVGYYGKAEMICTVPADRFMPAPKVDSAVIRITLWKEKPYVPKDKELFFKTIKAAFAQRRKTLSNSLSSGFQEIPKETILNVIKEMGWDAQIRGEKLSTKDFCDLSDALQKFC